MTDTHLCKIPCGFLYSNYADMRFFPAISGFPHFSQPIVSYLGSMQIHWDLKLHMGGGVKPYKIQPSYNTDMSAKVLKELKWMKKWLKITQDSPKNFWRGLTYGALSGPQTPMAKMVPLMHSLGVDIFSSFFFIVGLAHPWIYHTNKNFPSMVITSKLGVLITMSILALS